MSFAHRFNAARNLANDAEELAQSTALRLSQLSALLQSFAEDRELESPNIENEIERLRDAIEGLSRFYEQMKTEKKEDKNGPSI